MKVKSLSRVRLFATPWTAAYQAPPSMGFSRQEYWSGVPLPSPSGTSDKEPTCQCRRCKRQDSVAGLGRSPGEGKYSGLVRGLLSCIGEGNGNPLQCSCLENFRDGGAWWAAVYGVEIFKAERIQRANIPPFLCMSEINLYICLRKGSIFALT